KGRAGLARPSTPVAALRARQPRLLVRRRSRCAKPQAARAVERRPQLEAQDDVAELDAVAVLQSARCGDRLLVNEGLAGRGAVVDQQVLFALAANEGVLLLH